MNFGDKKVKENSRKKEEIGIAALKFMQRADDKLKEQRKADTKMTIDSIEEDRIQ